MKLPLIAAFTAISLSMALPCSSADTAVDPMLSFQGATGIINTPSAHVSREGQVHFNYTDQREIFWRDDRLKGQDNFLMSIGVFSFIELGGRITEVSGRGIRDLSASFKVSSEPLTRGNAYVPVLAAGIQDFGGGASHFQQSYIVLSQDLWRFRLSLGYGFGPDKRKGLFGGAEFKAHDWVTLLGEFDPDDINAGIRLISPEIWKTPLQLTSTLKSTLNHRPENINVSVGVTFPLDFRKKEQQQEDGNAAEPLSATPATPGLSARTAVAIVDPGPDQHDAGGGASRAETDAYLKSLYLRLVSAGFINVRVGQRDDRALVVEYENTIFNHNELDAIGVVSGIVAESAPGNFRMVHLAVVRRGIKVAMLSAPLGPLRRFMLEKAGAEELKGSFTFDYDTRFLEYVSYHPVEQGFVLPDIALILSPGLQTFVATEVGAFDYVLSLKPEVVVNLWKGAVYQARWDVPFAWSENFDDGRVFRGSRNDARMDRNMLLQGVRLAPGLLANLGGGMISYHNYGTLNEAVWTPGEGSHRLRAVQAWTRNTDSHDTSQVYLGAYRYLYAPLDLSCELVGGRFWGQDTGYSLELKRFFGDTAVSTYYKNSTTEAGKHWQAAGLQLSFPLTLRKDLKMGPVVVRGTDEWSYSQETTLAIGGQKTNNVVSQGLTVNPQPSTAIHRSFYNRDRLSGDYIREHLERLRESWGRYRTDVTP